MAFYTNPLYNTGLGQYGRYDDYAAEPTVNEQSLYVDPYRKGDQSAQETLADLYEAEFQDYLTRFFPVEQGLIQEMTTGFAGLQQEEISRAQQATARQYANIRGQQQRRLAGYGIMQRPGAEQDISRSETSALVAARNFARTRAEQRRLEVISGGLGSVLSGRTIGETYG